MHTIAFRPIYPLFRLLGDWAYTLFLFTYTDYKTILLPITVFGCISAPVCSCRKFLQGFLWIWMHLLQCNVSNQYKSMEEDAVIKPWRPLPSGRVTYPQGKLLRWLLVPLCILASSPYDSGVLYASASLTITTILYDELGLSGHWLGKNVSAVSGYAMFEIGATKIMGSSPDLDDTAISAIFYSATIILSTIHAQDFADIDGDKALGRVTFPIYWPEISRWSIPFAMITWSAVLICAWQTGFYCGLLFSGLGAWVGWRYLFLRTVQADRSSYLIYNIWLFSAHLLPAATRWPWLSF